MKLRVLCCALCALLLSSCAPRHAPTPSASPSPSAAALTVSPWYTTGKGDYVQGGFSVELSQAWQEQTVWETDETDTTYALSFYEPLSREAGTGGWLFSLLAIPQDLDYTEYPDYQLVGTLTTADGFVENLVALYPTDVEFPEEQAEHFASLTDQIPDILATIAATEGYTYQAQ